MRKGKLEKEYNHLTDNIDWKRFSSGKSCCITVRGYLDAHTKDNYIGIAEDNNYHLVIKRGFKTCEEAFQWADNQVNYKNEKIMEKE
jgi:hypothetical protein